MPANSPIPFPDSRSEASSIPANDQGAVISNSQSDSPERILRAGYEQDMDPLLTAQVTWSQNLGHAKVLTTFLGYGEVACQPNHTRFRNTTTGGAIGSRRDCEGSG
jgi:hypothetical protein